MADALSYRGASLVGAGIDPDFRFDQVPLEAGPLHSEAVRVTLPGATLVSFGMDRRVRGRGVTGFETVTLAAILRSDTPTRVLGRVVAPGDMVVMPPRTANEAIYGRGFRTLMLMVPPERLAALSADAAPALDPERLRAVQFHRPDPAASARLLGTARAALDTLDAAPGVVRSGAAMAALEEEILVRCLDVAGSATADGAILPAAPCAAHRLVRRAEDLVDAHPQRPLLAGELCAALRVSLRTLDRAFRTVLGTSPIAHLRSLRLMRVRAALLATDPATVTVSDVAWDWGFWHLGRFAAQYRALFGELPSRTLATRPAPAALAPAAARASRPAGPQR